jgi:hypothetical protein
MFFIDYKTGSTRLHATIRALSKAALSTTSKPNTQTRMLLTSEKPGIVFTVNKQLNVAALSIKSFDTGILRSVYKQNFDSTIQKIFIRLYNNHWAILYFGCQK